MSDENSILGALKSLNFHIQPRNSRHHLFHGTWCYGLDATKFRLKFQLELKIFLCFRFLLNQNRKHRNWFRFPYTGKGISAERKISVSFALYFHRRSSSTYHNSLVDLLFVSTVNIPNISLLPCIEVALNFFWTKWSKRMKQLH